MNSTGSPEEICIRWNEAPDSGSDCTFPIVPDCPSPDGPNWHRILGPTPATHGTWPHAGVTLDRNYCYAVFVRDDGNVPTVVTGAGREGPRLRFHAGPSSGPTPPAPRR